MKNRIMYRSAKKNARNEKFKKSNETLVAGMHQKEQTGLRLRSVSMLIKALECTMYR